MKRKWQGAAVALSATMVFAGMGGTALAASPGSSPASATAAKVEAKLPAQAQKIVTALEQLEPWVKAMTEREIDVLDADEGYVYLDMYDPKNTNVSASLTFDSKTGELISFESSVTAKAEKDSAVPSDKEILQKAKTSLVTLLGEEKLKGLGSPVLSVLVPDSEEAEQVEAGGTRNRVFYPFLVNGLQVNEGKYGIEVNTDEAGHLAALNVYRLDLTGIKVPDPKSALTPEAVKKQYFIPDRLDLGYMQEGKDGKPGLQYTLRVSPMIDATTGTQIDPTRGTAIDQGKRSKATIKNITLALPAKPLTAKSKAEAEKAVISLFGIDTKKEYIYPEEVAGDYDHTYTWFNEDQDYASVTFENETGILIASQFFAWSEQKPAPLKKEEALTKAVGFLEQVAPESSASLQVEILEPYKEAPLADWMLELLDGEEPEPEPGLYYAFLFSEMHKGLPILDRYHWILVNSEDGKVAQYSTTLPMKKVDFPDEKPAVSEQQAAEIIAKQLPLKQSYLWTNFYGIPAPSLSLVYTVDNSKGWPYVDAAKGSIEWIEDEE
ncbi:YcdB/YcdC domain-containing protein [Brevibacillus parabrevis]|uniref:YcdB/YcdC domain-containing protein n=1 Tax=Brevibacillus parabrevis TaxID=54914 RepID=UPI0028D2A496|nr:YcdB/YcdC domain-containing protein [Brevibacillus parabrevis]